tara:strand:- start:68 stop:637 length:570 start_codon:yes stop_codon:yes gene_type:complete
MEVSLFPTYFWKLKVSNHESIKERYLSSFIDGYENNIYKVPEGWITHKCHTSFDESKLMDRDICDEYASIFDSIFNKQWTGNFECWYQVYKNNEYQEWHDHMPSTLSAIHFLNFKKEHKAPMFQDPIRNLKATMNHAALNERMLETDKYTPEVEEGDIIIFPSYLQHTVPAGKYDSHRVTIALNLNVPL